MKKEFYEKIKIYYDGADIEKYSENPMIQGFTTNPSILKSFFLENKETRYKNLAKYFIKNCRNLPVSFEVFADDEPTMISQALEIQSWSPSIYVKIPIINSQGQTTESVIRKLNAMNVPLNITAMFTQEHVDIAYKSVENKNIPTIFSIFAGRIADTGVDPKPLCRYTVELLKEYPHLDVLWASTRELYNIQEAIDTGCHIITVPDSVLSKTKYIGKDLELYAQESVKMFYEDAIKSKIHF